MNYLLLFLEGLASFVSPCVLPIIPLYFSYLGGKKKDKLISSSIGFCLGFTIVFTVMGMISGYVGSTVMRFMPYIKIVFGLIIIVMGLDYLGIFKLGFLEKSNKKKFKGEKSGFWNSMIFGSAAALTWTPCVGAFLSSALMIVVEKGEAIRGGLMLLIYSLGIAIPFIVSAVLLDKINNFKFIKSHMDIIVKISGILLIGVGFYMILK